MKQLTYEIKKLQEEYYRKKDQADIGLIAGIIIGIAAILIWIFGSFFEAVPYFIMLGTLLSMSYECWRSHLFIGYAIETLESADEYFDRLLPKEDKNIP